MNRRYTGIIIGLFAIAALEFGLLGADAAGITSGGGGVPPVIERGVVETATATIPPWTPTPLATVTPIPQTPVSPPQVDITGAFLQADPLTIRCDGSQESTVTVRLVQPNGDPAPDGTFVSASAYNGSVFPYGAQTVDGYATFTVRFYDDIFPYGPNFLVRSGLFEAGIRIRCAPESDGGCPPSPPASSPPCGPTATPTPYPCNPSPGSGPASPPCPTKPPCGISPPSVSPPCATPTEPPFTSSIAMAIDCDTATEEIDDYCTVDVGSGEHAVAIYLRNLADSPVSVSAFDAYVDLPETSRLAPAPNDNPEVAPLPGDSAWGCLVLPDMDPAPERAVSLASCFNNGLAQPIEIAAGEMRRLFFVHYSVESGSLPGDVGLTFENGDAFDPFVTPLGSCSGSELLMECSGATLHFDGPTATPCPTLEPLTIASCGTPTTPTPTPTPTEPAAESAFALAIDCDVRPGPGAVGIQDDCVADKGSGAYDVDVYAVYTGAEPPGIEAFDAMVDDADTSRLAPIPGASSGLNENPDFRPVVEPTSWQCPTTVADSGAGGPGHALSMISCHDAALEDPITVGPAAITWLFRVHYEFPPDAEAGQVALSLPSGGLFDQFALPLGGCDDGSEPLMECRGATVTIVDWTPTPTLTPTGTPTSTPTPGDFELALDCDLAQAGIQDACSVPVSDGTLDVGVVLSNKGSDNVAMAAFNFEVRDDSEPLLKPPAISGPNLDQNPDFNQAALSADFNCDPVLGDQLPGNPATALSVLSCFSSNLGNAPVIAAGTDVQIATVHYNLITEGAPAALALEGANFFDASINEFGSCNDTVTVAFAVCRGATITILPAATPPPEEATSTPTVTNTPTPVLTITGTPQAGQALELAIDCDLALYGIQDACDVPPDDGTLAVGIVVLNVGSLDSTLAAFNFDVRDYNQKVLDPPSIPGNPLDRNPDVDQISLSANWICGPLTNDIDADDATVAVSRASCRVTVPLSGDLPVIFSSSQLRVATLHYNLIGAGGPVRLGIEGAEFFDRNVEPIGSCRPAITVAFVACHDAFITVSSPTATATPRATRTVASTRTPARTPTTLAVVTATRPPATPTAIAGTATAPTRTRTVVATATRKAGRRCADVNGDGRVSLRDVRLIAEHVALGTYAEQYDVNGDGRLTSRDVVRAVRQLGRRC